MALDPAIGYLGAAAITAGGQYFTNVSNASLNKNNRDWQERINREAREYNLPINQKKRLEAAGINPYSVMSGEGADVGNSNSEGESAPAAIPYQNPIPNNVALDLIQGMKLLSEKKGQDIANDQASLNLAFSETEKFIALRKTLAEIDNLLVNTHLSDTERSYLEEQKALFVAQYMYILKKSRAEANSTEIMSNNLQREYDDRHNESLASQAVHDANVRVSNAQIKEIGAMIGKIYKEVQLLDEEKSLTKEQKLHEIEKRLNTEENTKVLRARNFRESQKLRSEIVKDIFDMLTQNRLTKFGSLEFKFNDYKDQRFLEDDLLPYINNGKVPVRPSLKNSNSRNRSGIR